MSHSCLETSIHNTNFSTLIYVITNLSEFGVNLIYFYVKWSAKCSGDFSVIEKSGGNVGFISISTLKSWNDRLLNYRV